MPVYRYIHPPPTGAENVSLYIAETGKGGGVVRGGDTPAVLRWRWSRDPTTFSHFHQTLGRGLGHRGLDKTGE